MNDSIESRLPTFKKRMEERLGELEKLNETSMQARQTVTLDQSRVGRLSRMDAMQAQQMASETARRRTVEMQRIKSALLRMKKGDFGYCIRCDEEISLNRLEHDPSLPMCIKCA